MEVTPPPTPQGRIKWSMFIILLLQFPRLIKYLFPAYISVIGRCRGQMVRELDSRLQVSRFKPWSGSLNVSLGKHLTLTVPPSNQAPVVRRLDNAIHQINHYPVDECSQNKPRYPGWRVIFVADNVILLLNNPCQGHISWKPCKLLEPAKSFLVNQYLKTALGVRTPETSCMKRTSVHIKNTCTLKTAMKS